MILRADLHTHSYFSDGQLSPTDLVTAAHAAQVTHLALTDHDTLDGLPEARQQAQVLGIQLIDGVELSTQWTRATTKRAVSIHIVGLAMTDFAPLEAVLENQKVIRARRAETICAKLEKITKKPAWEAVLALAGGRAEGITRGHLAQWLVNEKLVNKQQQAFDRYLGEGKSAYVPLEWMSMADGVAAIVASGGQAVLAHPTRNNLTSTALRHLLIDFKAAGGQAIELPAVNEPPATRGMINRLVAEHGFAVSTASDFHGAHMVWNKLGNIPQLADGQKGVWELFG
jgi:predicted metal-dependent phosphoesterase TrpH